MRGVPLAVAAWALAACAGPIEPAPAPVGPGPIEPAPGPLGVAPVPAAVEGDSIRLARAGPEAFGFAEDVAAGCLLDGVLGGAAMIVDRSAERITIVGGEDILAEIAVAPSGSGTRIVLAGPAADDPRLRGAMLRELERAARTGDVTCPPLPA